MDNPTDFGRYSWEGLADIRSAVFFTFISLVDMTFVLSMITISLLVYGIFVTIGSMLTIWAVQVMVQFKFNDKETGFEAVEYSFYSLISFIPRNFDYKRLLDKRIVRILMVNRGSLKLVYALILASVSIVLSYPAFAEYEYFHHLNVKDSFNDCFLYCLNETEIIDNNCHMMHISGGYILGQSKKEYMIIYL